MRVADRISPVLPDLHWTSPLYLPNRVEEGFYELCL
jgi:hypothetical protein